MNADFCSFVWLLYKSNLYHNSSDQEKLYAVICVHTHIGINSSQIRQNSSYDVLHKPHNGERQRLP